MSNLNNQRSTIIDALRAAARVFASQRAYLRLLRSVKYLLGAVIAVAGLDLLFHLSSFPRAILLTGLLGSGLFLVGLTIFTMKCRRPTLDQAARELEKRESKLGSKLTNVLQLHAQAEDSDVDPLTRNLAKQAVVESADQVEPDKLPPLARFKTMRREVKLACCFLGGFCFLVLLLGKPAHRQLARIFDPYGDHPPLSFSWLEVTKPQEDGIEVIYGESATVEVKVSGHRLKDLFLEVAPADGSGESREVPMAALDEETFVVALDDIREPLTIFARSKNERSRSPQREIAVQLIPQITGAELVVTPPAYTGLPPQKRNFQFSGLQALQGSELTFRLWSNRPLGEGTLEALPRGENQEPLVFPLAPEADGSDREAIASLTATESGRVTFHLRDIDQREPEVTPNAALTVSRDLSPAIAILEPGDDAFVVEDHHFNFNLGCSDDYGIRRVRAFVAVNGSLRDPLEHELEGVGSRRHQMEIKLSLAELGAKPGDVITLSGEVIDNFPENPHLTRTSTRTLKVISTEQYNEYLRKQTDVAQISGKYEELLNRFDELVEAQKKIAEEGGSPEEQEALNEKLEEMAKEMENFGRENPVYDFEKDLQRELDERAQDIRDSVAQNKEEVEASDVDAAKKHHERLAQNQQQAEENILEPLEDLAALHELIKDFNEFQALYEEQQELKEHTKRFEAMELVKELDAKDRMSLQQLAPRQREVATALENLREKLKHHADLAEEKFPKAAQSARDLAQGIEHGGFPRLGRESSQAMVSASGGKSHERAAHLEEEMAKLISSCQGGCASCQSEGFDRYLKVPGRNPGNSFEQMMQSLNFSPSSGQGGSGSGLSGSMATGGMPGRSPALMGGEAMMFGAIAGKMSGGKGPGPGTGQGGGPTAQVDKSNTAKESLTSTRRTKTPESQSILSEYQNITDAYFRTLTSPK